MIDHTNGKILRQLTALGRENRRRHAFQRMLEASDKVLWRLEELNRDGVKTVPKPVRARILKLVDGMPHDVGEPLHDCRQVQEALDGVFEVQERLFKWRFPDWHDFDPEGDDYDAAAS